MKRIECLLAALICLCMAMTATGCGRKAAVIDPGFGGSGNPGGMGTGSGPNGLGGLPGVDQESLGPWESGAQYGLVPVYFDFDSAALRSGESATLHQNAERIKALAGRTVQIAGHCDERGTQEYNLALGERRALAVREYLIRMGVPDSRLLTISYGKEMPAVQGSGEDAWAQNRRAEFAVTK